MFHEALTDSLGLGGLLLRGELYSISLDLSPPDAAVTSGQLLWLGFRRHVGFLRWRGCQRSRLLQSAQDLSQTMIATTAMVAITAMIEGASRLSVELPCRFERDAHWNPQILSNVESQHWHRLLKEETCTS